MPISRMEHLTRSIACTERNLRMGPKRCQRSPIPHGTATGYTNRGCRCEPCRVAVREYRKQLNAARPGIPNHKHGTLTAYKSLGCRCADCRQAVAVWAYQRRHQEPTLCQCGREVPKGSRKHCSARCRERLKPSRIAKLKRAARLRYFRARSQNAR